MRTGVHLLREAASEPGTPAELDSEFLQKANTRLALLSAVFAGVVGVLMLTSAIFYRLLGWEAPTHLPHFMAAQSVLLLLSLGMAGLARAPWFSPRTVVRLGLTYQILGAFVISFCAFHGDMLVQPVMIKLSWLAVWILLFPFLVPGSPRVTFGVSLACASTAPLVFLFWSELYGQALPTAPVLADTFLPYYICAGLAMLPAWLVHDMGSSFTLAREEARRLGSYRLVERLGEGGMGEVWRAEHELLARATAIKLIRPDALGPEDDPRAREEALVRFEREARATASLRSPHTVSLFDYGVADDGTFYYAMELLEGLDLESLVNRFGPVPPERAAHFLRQACKSLAEAHRLGLIHRDIKPSNLVACLVGEEYDFLKILDFGLVTHTEAGPESEPPMGITGRGYLVGTPAFVAPETVSGKPVDGRADLYALGCVGYWLLTGRLVFERSSATHMMADHVHIEPEPPSARTKQHIPPLLEQVIMDCLHKDPVRRPQTADALERRIATLGLDEPWTQKRARYWWYTQRAALARKEPAVSATPTWSSVAAHVLDSCSPEEPLEELPR